MPIECPKCGKLLVSHAMSCSRCATVVSHHRAGSSTADSEPAFEFGEMDRKLHESFGTMNRDLEQSLEKLRERSTARERTTETRIDPNSTSQVNDPTSIGSWLANDVDASSALKRAHDFLSPSPLLPLSARSVQGDESTPRFLVDRILGAGGLGVVYLARDIKLNRLVAIKVIRDNHDDLLVARFLREMKTMASLTHPNIVIVYDADNTSSPPYLVMEYLPDGDLSHKCGQLPLELVIEIGVQICDAMVEAHRAGVIHRDIKPSNILMTRQGIPKLSDFGIAKQVEVSQLTKTGMGMGTPLYWPPEQALDAKSVDARSDVFSLGATLYHLATGKSPLYPRWDMLPARLADILRRSMQINRDQRYASGEEFLAALSGALRDL